MLVYIWQWRRCTINLTMTNSSLWLSLVGWPHCLPTLVGSLTISISFLGVISKFEATSLYVIFWSIIVFVIFKLCPRWKSCYFSFCWCIYFRNGQPIHYAIDPQLLQFKKCNETRNYAANNWRNALNTIECYSWSTESYWRNGCILLLT